MISLTVRAADRLRELRGDTDGELLRVSSCCAGRRYVLEFDDASRPGDVIGESHGTLVVMDEANAELFGDVELDYDEDHGAFSVDGPRLVSGRCTCDSVGDDDPEEPLAGGGPLAV
jgi:Fe-S cluster assembly iron-binding protein IscA